MGLRARGALADGVAVVRTGDQAAGRLVARPGSRSSPTRNPCSASPTPFGSGSKPLPGTRHERHRFRPPARNRLQAILRDLLTLARRFRRPPYGYRGLTPEQSKEGQGSFVSGWGDRPLPPRSLDAAYSGEPSASR